MNATATTKTLAELQAEAAAAQEALAAAQRAEKQAREEAERKERNAKFAAARKASHDKWLPIFEAIAAELKTGHYVEATVKPCTEADFERSTFCEPKMQLPNGGYLSINSDASLTVFSYGCGKGARYPRRNDGTFNVAKIAETLADNINACRARMQREAKEKASKDASASLALSLREEFGLKNGNVTRSEYYADKVCVTLNRQCTEEEARKLLALLKDNGFIA